jgi:hypothetical protein
MTLEIEGKHRVSTDPCAMRGNVNGAINQDMAWKSMSR